MPRAYVSIGSNIAPKRHVPSAVRDLAERYGRIEASSVYQTPAVGFHGADFLNLVVGFDTHESPHAVAAGLRAIEDRHGRHRGGERFAPRTLDLDLLLYGDTVMNETGLQLPRDEITRHAFVLGPLAELAGDRRHPVSGIRLAALWEAMCKTTGPLTRVTNGSVTQGPAPVHGNHLTGHIPRIADEE